MNDLDLTLAAIAKHGWRVVLLGHRSKRPVGAHWHITTDIKAINRHLEQSGGIGLVCGPQSGVAVLDPDDEAGWALMVDDLGLPGPPTVQTGSGRQHFYVRWVPGLDAKLQWAGPAIIGEIQRGPGQQHVVMPPSLHPNGTPYRWLGDPREPLAELNGYWRVAICDMVDYAPTTPVRS